MTKEELRNKFKKDNSIKYDDWLEDKLLDAIKVLEGIRDSDSNHFSVKEASDFLCWRL